MESNETWPIPKDQSKSVIVHRGGEQLMGKFANLFTIHYNGDNFVIEFCTTIPRQEDNTIEQTLTARIFITQKGLITLSNTIQQVVENIQKMNTPRIESPDSQDDKPSQ